MSVRRLAHRRPRIAQAPAELITPHHRAEKRPRTKPGPMVARFRVVPESSDQEKRILSVPMASWAPMPPRVGVGPDAAGVAPRLASRLSSVAPVASPH